MYFDISGANVPHVRILSYTFSAMYNAVYIDIKEVAVQSYCCFHLNQYDIS